MLGPVQGKRENQEIYEGQSSRLLEQGELHNSKEETEKNLREPENLCNHMSLEREGN